jgi:CubicO group peptidase (beta-lactamase class C family)
MAYWYLCVFLLISIINNSTSSNCPSRQWIEESLNKSIVPGAAIVVVNATDILYEEAFGYHSLLPIKWMDVERSIFTLASISKTFIAVAVMQLVEEELVDLDTDINQYLLEPDHRIFHPNYSSHSITLRKLLSHSASIAVSESTQLGLYRLNDTAFDQATLSEALFTYVNPNTSNWLPKPPGSVSFYSNEGSSLAGFVVEKVTNMSFDQYVKEKIMKPLQIDISQVGVRLADFANREDLVKHYAYAVNASHLSTWLEGIPQLNVTPFLVNIFIVLRGANLNRFYLGQFSDLAYDSIL